MDTSEFSRISSLYAQGKVSKEAFQNAVSRFRRSEFMYEESPMSKYYKNLSQTMQARAVKDEQERLRLSGLLDKYYADFDARYTKVKEQSAAAGINIGKQMFAPLRKQMSDLALERSRLYAGTERKSLEQLVKESTSKRGNVVTYYGSIAKELAPFQMDYEDYSQRSQDALAKYNQSVETEKKKQLDRFTDLKTELLGSAESMSGPRERVYTERPL